MWKVRDKAPECDVRIRLSQSLEADRQADLSELVGEQTEPWRRPPSPSDYEGASLPRRGQHSCALNRFGADIFGCEWSSCESSPRRGSGEASMIERERNRLSQLWARQHRIGDVQRQVEPISRRKHEQPGMRRSGGRGRSQEYDTRSEDHQTLHTVWDAPLTQSLAPTSRDIYAHWASRLSTTFSRVAASCAAYGRRHDDATTDQALSSRRPLAAGQRRPTGASCRSQRPRAQSR